MSLGMYNATIPMMKQLLTALSKNLDKAAAFAEAKKVDPLVLTGSRLAPDMFALARQVQIASDQARGGVSRLAGVEMPAMADTETTIDELKERIAKTIAYIDGFTPAQIDGSETREITLKMRAGEMKFTGQNYLFQSIIPNFTFHCVTAYNILRHNGVEIGKRDFLGG
jgi:hypothetical protein